MQCSSVYTNDMTHLRRAFLRLPVRVTCGSRPCSRLGVRDGGRYWEILGDIGRYGEILRNIERYCDK